MKIISGALSCGLINILITDEDTGLKLLNN